MDTVELNQPMPDENQCPQCGTPLGSGAVAGLCPACLFKAGAAADTITDAKDKTFAPPDIAELAPKFPQLEILELIGKGGMGAVYKARQKELDRIVALKILPPGIGGDPAFAERFAREAKALAKLNHPGIVTIYDFGRTDGLFYFFMEYVDGVNLRQLLQAGRVSPREALAIVPQICDALQFAHDQGIVHRDIKPENILLDRRGRVKVADFGLAKIVGDVGQAFQPAGAGDFPVASSDAAVPSAVQNTELESPANRQAGKPALRDLTDAGKVMGTPQYMSPEQKEHPEAVDHRADIYALGVVFYQMLTGELPGKKIEPPSSKVQIDVRLDEVVLRALEKKPELRYQQAIVLKTQVETIAGTPGNETASTAPAGTPLIRKSQMVRLVEVLFNDSITSPLAAKLINISALGFLGSLGFLGNLPFPQMHPCFGFFGFFGLFGLIGFAFMVESAERRKKSGAHPDGTRTKSALSETPGRFSRKAIWSAAWALLSGVSWVWNYTPPGWMITNALRDALGNWAVGLMTGPLSIIAFAAPVGVTWLGWLAINEIRRSQGQLRGLAVALADGVLFPLLLLDLWLVWLCQRIGAATSGVSHPDATTAVICGLILGVILDVILITRLWRRIQTPLPPLRASPDSTDGNAGSEKSWRKLIWRTLPRAGLIGIVQICLMETILQMTVHQPESTGELWDMALWSGSLAAMGWAAWPLRRVRFRVAAVVTGTLVFFAALCGIDFFYSTQIRPNLGLYAEEDWLVQWPVGRWNWRQMTANALWHQPAAGPFNSTVETILPLDEQHPVALLDLDTGRQQNRDQFAVDDEETRAWMQAEKFDLAIVSGKNKITVLGFDLDAGYVPVPLVRIEELTPQAAVNYWALDRKPANTVADLQVYKDMTGTYAFRTREGGIGFVEFAGFAENLRGVKIRYKLVRSETQNVEAATQRDPFIVRGRVVDEQGKGLGGVTITASCGLGTLWPTGATQSRDDGSYELHFHQGMMMQDEVTHQWRVGVQAATIHPAKAGYFDANLNRQGDLLMADRLPAPGENAGWKVDTNKLVVPNRPFELNFVMLPAAKITGRLRDEGGSALTNWSVCFVGEKLPPSSNVFEQTDTDVDGQFQFANLPTNGRWWFTAERHSERKEFRSEEFTLPTPGVYAFEVQWNSTSPTSGLMIRFKLVQSPAQIPPAPPGYQQGHEVPPPPPGYQLGQRVPLPPAYTLVQSGKVVESSEIEPADLHEARAKLAELRTHYGEHHPEIQRTLARITELERMTKDESGAPADLREANAYLAGLRVDYGDNHPEVLKALARIKELQRMSKEEPNASAELREAKACLAELRVDYAESHPNIQRQLARVKELERQPREGSKAADTPDPLADLKARLEAASSITSFTEQDKALAAIARDAAKAGEAALAKQALAKMTAFTAQDQAALEAARELVKAGRRTDAIDIARSITSFTQRDAALKELAQ